MLDHEELEPLTLALHVLDAASRAAEQSLLRAYPMLDEDPCFDPHALDDDPHEVAAEIAFILRSLRNALHRHRRICRRAARQHARPAARKRAR